ncbi:uncharacterized protein LOC123376604 isoform X2 [Mauremys mutica]|uniref:uncharacterized protein LOC123376604 isoform X2 n=1 Tax=Mauremys mutica TaxID=74926 RepID=UPI001D16D1C9|nr:uncharacterized protein LOC123376604 isoform X2 [Mauremys mutica]
MKDANTRIMRWYLSLKPYSFHVLHQPGKAHGNADFFFQVREEEGEEMAKGQPGPRAALRGKVCDGAEQPRTGTAGVNPSFLAEEAMPKKLCWACCNWRTGIKACRPAQSGLTTGGEGCRLLAPEEGESVRQDPGVSQAQAVPETRIEDVTGEEQTGGPPTADELVLTNCFYYWGFAAWIAYYINHPLYTPPSYGQKQINFAVIMFLICEAGNFSIHVALSDLRRDGSKIHKIPYPTKNPFTWLFFFVTCPNYTYEVGAWISFTIMTQCVPVGLFTFLCFIQMTVWAKDKHYTYIREFKDYPSLRMPIIPFLL